jgi:hypothetical protein
MDVKIEFYSPNLPFGFSTRLFTNWAVNTTEMSRRA